LGSPDIPRETAKRDAKFLRKQKRFPQIPIGPARVGNQLRGSNSPVRFGFLLRTGFIELGFEDLPSPTPVIFSSVSGTSLRGRASRKKKASQRPVP
jgi:hypothetical protein